MKTNILSARSALAMAGVALCLASMPLGGCTVATADADVPEAVSEAREAISFPGSSPTTIGSNTTSYQPSGLALHGGSLYMASNDSKIAKYNPSTGKWVTTLTGVGDVESLTETNAGQLLAGVEGSGSSSASILLLNSTGTSVTASWTLSGVTGMEAMTFVPEAYTPFGTASSSPFAGYFFVATQNNVGHIRAYRLNNSGTATLMKDYTISNTLQTSDMMFANGVLYVLFDDNNTTDLLGVYVINVNPSNQILAYQKDYDLPSLSGSTANYEALIVDGRDIYLGRDSNAAPSTNAVYEYTSTLIYPLSVLPPQSW